MNSLTKPTLHIPAHTCSALQVEALYNISRSRARYMIHNFWTIPADKHHLLKEYIARKWDARFFLENISEGMLEHQGINYQIICDNTSTPAIRKALKEEAIKPQVWLSFRSLQPEFKSTPTVLVSLALPASDNTQANTPHYARGL